MSNKASPPQKNPVTQKTPNLDVVKHELQNTDIKQTMKIQMQFEVVLENVDKVLFKEGMYNGADFFSMCKIAISYNLVCYKTCLFSENR